MLFKKSGQTLSLILVLLLVLSLFSASVPAAGGELDINGLPISIWFRAERLS